MTETLLAALLAVALLALVACVVGLVVVRRRLAAADRRLGEAIAARDVLLQRDRELSVNASHRLRTPITALRLSLDDLARWPQTPADVSEELDHAIGEIDRWGEAVEEVLGRARGQRSQDTRSVDLSDVTAEYVKRRAADLPGRRLTHRTRGPVPAVVDPASVEKVLDLMLEHLRHHGSGDLRLDVAARSSHLQVRLSDESPRALPPGVIRECETRDTCGQLEQAGTFAESLGGYVAVEDRDSTRLILLLPAPPVDAPGR